MATFLQMQRRIRITLSILLAFAILNILTFLTT